MRRRGLPLTHPTRSWSFETQCSSVRSYRMLGFLPLHQNFAVNHVKHLPSLGECALQFLIEVRRFHRSDRLVLVGLGRFRLLIDVLLIRGNLDLLRWSRDA